MNRYAETTGMLLYTYTYLFLQLSETVISVHDCRRVQQTPPALRYLTCKKVDAHTFCNSKVIHHAPVPTPTDLQSIYAHGRRFHLVVAPFQMTTSLPSEHCFRHFLRNIEEITRSVFVGSNLSNLCKVAFLQSWNCNPCHFVDFIAGKTFSSGLNLL